MKKIVSVGFTILLVLVTSIAYPDDPCLVIDTGGHKAIINYVIFTSDGRYLVSAADDKVVQLGKSPLRKKWGHGGVTKALNEGLSGEADGYGGQCFRSTSPRILRSRDS